MNKKLDAVLSSIEEIRVDPTVPRNIKSKMEEVGKILKENELSLGTSKALGELEFVSNDVNMESFTRMQILSVISQLENLCA